MVSFNKNESTSILRSSTKPYMVCSLSILQPTDRTCDNDAVRTNLQSRAYVISAASNSPSYSPMTFRRKGHLLRPPTVFFASGNRQRPQADIEPPGSPFDKWTLHRHDQRQRSFDEKPSYFRALIRPSRRFAIWIFSLS